MEKQMSFIILQNLEIIPTSVDIQERQSEAMVFIQIVPSDRQFTPAFMDKKKQGMKVPLENIRILPFCPFSINPHFKINSIIAQPESTHKAKREYYKEIKVEIEDVRGTKKNFFHHIVPEQAINVDTLNGLFKDLNGQLADFKTFMEMEYHNTLEKNKLL